MMNASTKIALFLTLAMAMAVMLMMTTTTMMMSIQIFKDLNRDGLFDLSETGLSNVAVALYDCDGNNNAVTIITDSDGFYKFPNVEVGCYLIAVNKERDSEFSPVVEGENQISANPSEGLGNSSPKVELNIGDKEESFLIGMYQLVDPPPTPPSTSTPTQQPTLLPYSFTTNAFDQPLSITEARDMEAFFYKATDEFWRAMAFNQPLSFDTAKVTTPTASPSFDPAKHIGGCPDEWVGGTNTAFEEGDMVSITVSTSPLQKIAYTCKAWPFSGFCGRYAPNSGLPDDQQGWTTNGGCTSTIAHTTAPSFGTLNLVAGGCPQDYDENNLSGIEAGDQVSLVMFATPDERRVVYECKSGAISAYCSNVLYIPGGPLPFAWDLKGYCDGTTAYNNAAVTAPATCEQETDDGEHVNKCHYEKDITTAGLTCTCSDADCPNPDGLTGSACKKDVTKTNCPSVDVYSSSATYEAGDVVRIGAKKFQCKAWPYYMWCGNSTYEPSLEAGVWTDAWSEIGDCPA